ncbi:Cell division protein FtsZ [Rickettsiales endosymbiont of Paramecium tredecaurelia]|uniref:cell division protein FtsZ n=1 Tax=Candidatus Sarmatiella mevalonica TaxID=2770581 RepID=UPI0019236B73|nr:cell division protein FtsZ [Candidatus Sarmatiella mevalonica]MBL3284466.1 Cell division protein FtsZ [Candidatus Sarmatiella mevalonica]
MAINLKAVEQIDLKPVIVVLGVGGAGTNAVNNMIQANLLGATFVVANTDAQSLEHSLAEHKIQLGANATKGLGAGASPEVGGLAAEESLQEIQSFLAKSNMVFITAGMGGGTGTGAAPVIARIAKEMGILTVAVVTRPFDFEGAHRAKIANKGLIELKKVVDTLIVIPNQNLFKVANTHTTFADAFKMADNVLYDGVRCITDLIIKPGLINLDFADIKAVMSQMGEAVMGTGQSDSEDRATAAADSAISNPLLAHNSMNGAKGVLINITGGLDMTLFEVDSAANRIREAVNNDDANVIVGSTFDDSLEGVIRVSVIATGIDANLLEQLGIEVQEKKSATVTSKKMQFAEPIEEVPVFNSYIPNIEDDARDGYDKSEEYHAERHGYETSAAQHHGQFAYGSYPHPPAKKSFLSKVINSFTNKEQTQNHHQSETVRYHNKMQIDSDVNDVPAFFRTKKNHFNQD